MKKHLLALAAVFVLLTAQVCQASNYALKIDETYQQAKYEFVYDGKTLPSSTIIVKNLETSTPVTLALYGLDGDISGSGNASLKLSNLPQVAIGKWLQFDQPKVTLAPLEEKTLSFKLNLPPNLTPGTYVGGISAEESTPETATPATGSSFSAKVVTRLVKVIYLQIPGEKINKYSFHGFSFNKKLNQFSFTLDNQGNTLLAANGYITVTDTSTNKILKTFPISASGVLQNDSFKGQYSWTDAPQWGSFRADIMLNVMENDIFNGKTNVINRESGSVNFELSDYASFIPYAIGVLVVLLLILAYVIMHRLYLSKCVKYKVAAGDTVNSVAAKFGMRWQKLVGINKIRPPYELKPNTTILVRKK